MLFRVLDFEDGFAFVRATTRTHMMGKMHLATAFAAHQMLQRECVVRAALILTAN
jgi:hypothetical protein